MAKQTISIGTTANDHTGDTLRVAFDKVNDNFTELYNTTSADIQIPLQTGNDGKYLTTDGSTLSWATVDGGGADLGQLYVTDGDTILSNDAPSFLNMKTNDNGIGLGTNFGGPIYLSTTNGETNWTFGSSGDLSLPSNGGIVFDRADTTIRVGMGFHIASGEGISLDAIDQTDPENPLYKNWYFSPDGNMFLPNPGVIKNPQGSVNIVSADYAQLQWTTPNGVSEADPNGTGELTNWIYVESGGVIVETNLNGPGIPFSWSFNTDGSVSIPYQSSNNRTGNGDVLMFAKHNAQQKIIGTQPGTVSYPTVERLVIAGGDSYTDGTTYSGEGGDIYLWAGYGADGGDIKVDAGNGVNSGGSVKVRGGNSIEGGNGGFIEITSGYSSTGDGGDITIMASNAYANGGSVNIISGTGNTSNGNVTITTPSHTWTFGSDGITTLPGAGTISANGIYLNGDLSEGYAHISLPNNANASTTPVLISNDIGDVKIATMNPIGLSSHYWTFDNNGKTTLPGATILSTVEVDAGSNIGTIAIDLTKQVNKLHPWGSGGVVTGDQYTLADGVEGQIIHLVPHNSYNSGDEYTTVKLAHARYREMGTGNIVEVADASWWLPFGGNLTGSDQIGAYNALVTLIFTDGYWNLPHSIFD